ncbi:MAG: carboxypeptidase-like regulatory domain-containing protein [Acidobacteriia bacterium]|nr:carboxypeptidase-like regulatory domain-containing protein [Terriglobia bacterium]
MNHWKRLAVWLLCLGFPLLIWSQTGLTSLRGTVTDPSGAMLAGAAVTLENPATGFHTAHSTDQNGAYEFPQIPPGKYTITVTKAGFGKQAKTAELLVSQPATINFALSVQAIAETVEVSDIAQTVNTTDATIGNAVSNSTIQALPMEGRNVPDLLSLQPGVVWVGNQQPNARDRDSRNGAVAGARSDQSNVTLDGIDNNDQRQGYAFTGVLRSTLDSVEEFRVTTTNSNADSGRSSGAQVTLVTKSGTNTFHGSLYEYNRNSLGHANDWFNKAAELQSGLPNKPGKLIRNTFGGTFGGPIKKDKIFFFLNYEGQKTQENKQQNLTVPTASFKAGSVSYNCAGDPLCPAGGVQTLTAAQVASMDPLCTTTCPWGPGEDPNALATLNAYPDPNSPGGDGLNTGGFTWSAPNPTRLNTYIAKLDYQLTTGQRLFVRGNLQGDRSSSFPQFPGTPPSAAVVDTAKGIAIGHTWTISSTLINNFRYGYVRQALNNVGAGNNSFSDFVGISPLTAEDTTTLLNVPVHNFVDDVTWVKGKHTLQLGANYRLIHNNSSSNGVSFSSAASGNTNISQAAIAGTGQSFDPAAFGFAGVSGDFSTSYDNAITAIAGLLSTINVHNNYRVTNATTATLLPTGSMIPRDFKANEFEWYVQDSWRVKPNLTITIGLRHTLLQTPYEVHGQQVAPTIDLHQWFNNRALAAAQGTGNQPEFAFAPSGQSRGGKPYWSMNKLDFAPRFAVAYAPDSRTSIRVGVGMYHDHFGEGIVDGFSQFGSFGLTSTQAAPSNIFTPDDAPRYIDRNVVPPLQSAPQTVTYPVFPPADTDTGFTFNSNGIDGRIKTPHSFAADFSIQRQVGKGWTFEAAYVGRFGRHLLQQRDLAAATNLVDPKSGMDYYTAARMMSEFALAHGEDSTATIDPIAYFENLFPTAAAGGFSATQNIYTGSGGSDACPSGFRWANRPGREVGAPFRLGLLATQLANGGVSPVCAGLPPVPFWDPQFSSLFAWSSLGTSSYNAGQFMLRHPMAHGLQVDFSYTYSKSLDLGSDAERTNSQGTTSTTSTLAQGTSTVLSYIANPWNPRLNRAPSDFDLRHVITANWLYELPFGKGKDFAGGAGTLLDAAIGGWQLSGLTRWTSGFPFSVIDNRGFTQNFLFNSNMVQTAPIKSGLFMINGAPYAFPDPSAVVAGVQITPGVAATLTPMRFAYPGEAGSRNNFRGQGYFGIDMGLAKTWKIHEKMNLKFAWEVFNVTNSVRFDTNTGAQSPLDNGSDDGSFGLYRKTLTVERVQQFSLRFSF